MKYINIIIILSIAFAISACQTPIPDPDADAVFKSIKKVYQLNNDGSVDYHYQHQLKYITHYSFNRLYGESFIVYNPEFQELKINKSLTTMADGKKVPSPDNAFNEVLPRFAAGAPVFNHLREMVVTHAGLELGCMVDFNYDLKTKSGYYPFLNENIVLAENVPVQNLEIEIKVPKGQVFNYKIMNVEAEPKVSSQKGFDVYTFKFENIASVDNASNEPHDGSFHPKLIFSTVSVKEVFTKVLSKADLVLDKSITNVLNERLKNATKEIEKVQALQKLVGSEINTFRVPIQHTGFSIRPLSEVWNDNGATYLEKTLLFTEALKYAGFVAEPVFAYPGLAYDESVGNLVGFGHCYVKTQLEGEDILLATSSRQSNNVAFDIASDILVGVNGEVIDHKAMINGIENKISYTSNMKINADGTATAVVDAQVTGATFPYFKFLKDENSGKSIITALVPGNMIKDVETLEFDKGGCKATARVDVDMVWNQQGDYFFIPIPEASNGINKSRLRTLTAERKSPLHLSYTVDENYDFTMEIPQSVELVGPNVSVQLSNSAGTLNFEIYSEGSVVHIKKNLKIDTQTILPAQYPDFKAIMDVWNKAANKELIFKKIQ